MRGAEVGGVDGGGPVGGAVVARDGVGHPRDLGAGSGATAGLPGLARASRALRRAPHGPGRRRRRVAPDAGCPGCQRREHGARGGESDESHRTSCWPSAA